MLIRDRVPADFYLASDSGADPAARAGKAFWRLGAHPAIARLQFLAELPLLQKLDRPAVVSAASPQIVKPRRHSNDARLAQLCPKYRPAKPAARTQSKL